MKVSTSTPLARRLTGSGALAVLLLTVGCAGPGAGPGAGNPAADGAATGTIASETTQANVRRVGFLSDYGRLAPLPGGGGMLCWSKAGTNWHQYNQVMFERIKVFLNPGATQPVDPTDLKMLIDYFHSDLVKAITPQAAITQTAGPGVLRVRIALTDLVPTNTAASLAGTAVPYGFVAEIGSGAATGKPAGSTPYLGQTGMEVQFLDGASGDVLAECADREIGLKYAADMNAGVAGAAETWISGYMDSFAQWSYAKAAFDKWSGQFAQHFATLRAK